MIRKNLIEAMIDFKYLLDRGYKKESVLDVVVSRYRLSSIERMILFRTIFPSEKAKKVLSKARPINEIVNNLLVIDGFNVLMTIRAALLKSYLFLCGDGFIRDMLSFYSKVKVDQYMYIALEILFSLLYRLKPLKVVFVYDKNVSYSGKLSGYTRRKLKEMGICGDSILAFKADVAVIKLNCLTSTSDTVILTQVDKVVDLGGYIASIVSPEKIINVRKIVYN